MFVYSLLLWCICYSKDRATDVICELLKKYKIVDSPSQFVLYEKDMLSSKKIVLLLLCVCHMNCNF